MRLINLIVPVAMIATVALFAPHADAQTAGEYATTVGVASGDGTSFGTSVSNTVGADAGGGSRTWGDSSLGGSFEERAGAASSSAGGADFDSRAGSMRGGSDSESRWPAASSRSGGGESSDRFGGSGDGSSGRFSTSDRFTERTDLSASTDRFQTSQFNDNQMGLDTHYSISGLDGSHSSN